MIQFSNQPFYGKYFKAFTPRSDQFQISLTASPEILHHTVWRTWIFVAYSDERWLCYQFLLRHLYIYSLKCWENVHFELGSERLKLFQRFSLGPIHCESGSARVQCWRHTIHSVCLESNQFCSLWTVFSFATFLATSRKITLTLGTWLALVHENKNIPNRRFFFRVVSRPYLESRVSSNTFFRGICSPVSKDERNMCFPSHMCSTVTWTSTLTAVNFGIVIEKEYYNMSLHKMYLECHHKPSVLTKWYWE